MSGPHEEVTQNVAPLELVEGGKPRALRLRFRHRSWRTGLDHQTDEEGIRRYAPGLRRGAPGGHPGRVHTYASEQGIRHLREAAKEAGHVHAAKGVRRLREQRSKDHEPAIPVEMASAAPAAEEATTTATEQTTTAAAKAQDRAAVDGKARAEAEAERP